MEERIVNVEFYQFIQQLVKDPRLPGTIQDIIVEAGNSRYQAVMDSYVLEGEPVPLAERRAADSPPSG